VDSAPINPSDLAFFKGSYSSAKKFPTVPGFEGSGTIVSSGGGLQGWGKVGKRVAVAALGQWGTYAEYCIVNATSCVELDNDMTF
jgi:NADPH:quinone reductase-like Zn-dependent oxidoreductase